MKDNFISIDSIDVFIFDFDGVLTDNIVLVDQNGKESVSCSRADGLAFDVLHKLKKFTYILSTEKNPVVEQRAKKLKIQVLQGIGNKAEALKDLAIRKSFNLSNALYVGNDINDYRAMQLCGYSVCPADSHPKIKNISDVVLKTLGGKGVVRELLEEVFEVDFIKTLEPKT